MPNFFFNIKKYEFHIMEISHLGFITNSHGIKIDLAKIKRILEWQPPICLIYI